LAEHQTMVQREYSPTVVLIALVGRAWWFRWAARKGAPRVRVLAPYAGAQAEDAVRSGVAQSHGADGRGRWMRQRVKIKEFRRLAGRQ